MTDYFALLREPHRPWLDAEALKKDFLVLSSAVHPDRFHNAPESERSEAGQRYAELNTAYQCLRDPKDRLQHLLTLELGAKPKDVQRIPPGTMELFMEVGQTCRDADAFQAERAKVTSPMLKVQLFQRGLEWTDQLTALQKKINARRDELQAELQSLNTIWDSAPPIGSPHRTASLPLERLEQIYRALSYVSRWTEQIQERMVQMAM